MSTHRRVKSKDEELGKREDDIRPRAHSAHSNNFARPWRWRRRRILAAIAGIILLYFFFRNIPIDFEPLDGSSQTAWRPGSVTHGSGERREPTGAPPRGDNADDEQQSKHYYEGPIKFYKLAASLRPALAKTNGGRILNRNVLFAASSLKSVANLMPMACEMGKWDRNYVHLAVLGRDPLPLGEILEINGLGEDDCNVYFHDARSDYSDFSNEKRAEVAVAGAMKHINDFMHPQAFIMDDASLEDQFFTSAMKRKTKEYRRPLIEVPDGKYEDFLWITRLDSGSLANWFEPTIDILIQVPRDSSGGLLRLVNSLRSADYGGLRKPRLTIDFPPDIEPFAQNYLAELEWPPEEDASPPRTSTLTLHHRIPSSRVASEEAAFRFLETFYPTSTDNNHVLVLSPQVEVNPLYLQYLHYAMLEYKYSAYSSFDSDDLLGISLDVPTSFINGSRGFKQPTVADMDLKEEIESNDYAQSASSPFLYQAPSSTANLIFGDKWATFHSFLRNRLAASHAGKSLKTKKIVSEAEPAWTEYLLELMRARAWHVIHPASSLVTVHNELARIPEEYIWQNPATPDALEEAVRQDYLDDEPFLTAPVPPTIPQRQEKETGDGLLPLHDVLPFDGDLPELQDLPYVRHTGEIITTDRATDWREEYNRQFRRQVGGCGESEASRRRVLYPLKTGDLFCMPGIEPQFEPENYSEEETAAEAIVKATTSDSESEEPLQGATSSAKPDGKIKEPEVATAETIEDARAREVR